MSKKPENPVDDPRYIDASEALISEALQLGQDIVQLDNGDIVTTETKVITTRHSWDADEGKFVRASARRKKK